MKFCRRLDWLELVNSQELSLCVDYPVRGGGIHHPILLSHTTYGGPCFQFLHVQTFTDTPLGPTNEMVVSPSNLLGIAFSSPKKLLATYFLWTRIHFQVPQYIFHYQDLFANNSKFLLTFHFLPAINGYAIYFAVHLGRASRLHFNSQALKICQVEDPQGTMLGLLLFLF